jgi:hypothetical protein
MEAVIIMQPNSNRRAPVAPVCVIGLTSALVLACLVPAGRGRAEPPAPRPQATELPQYEPIPAAPAENGENGSSGKQKSEQRQTEKGYWYEIKREDKLSVIVQEYRKKGVKVTLAQVKDANPDVNPNRLLVGQKIWIPDTSAK